MAEAEVGLKMTLKGRREAAQGLTDIDQGLQKVADGAQDVEKAAEGAERSLLKASSSRIGKGFLATGRGVASLAGNLSRGLYRGAVIGTKALGALAVAAGVVGVKSIGLAGDAKETASAFNTVFGPSARGIQKDLDQLTNRFGTYNPALQDATRQFGVFGKAAGVAGSELPAFSTDLVKAGLDLGSFYNQDPSQVFEALQSGLSGEAEPLRKFGIFLSDASLGAFALSQGITKSTKDMTDQEKVALRQAYIMANLGDAQGDLARTSGGLANQQRGLTDRFKTFFTMVGGPLSTAATGAFQGMNAIAQKGIRMLKPELPALEKRARSLSRTFADWGKETAKNLPSTLDRVRAGASKVSAAWSTMSDKLAGLSSGDAGNQLGILKDNLTELKPAIDAFKSNLPGISDAMKVVNVVMGFAADHVDKLAKLMPYLAVGYGLLKVSQIAANVVLAASLPLKIMEIATNRSLVKSNQALIASRTGVAASTVAGTAATAASAGVTAASTAATNANTTAEKAGIVAKARAVVVTGAKKVAELAGAAATKAVAAGQWLLNAAMTANPIGLVVVAIAALVGGLVLAYKKSDTFRAIVNAAFSMVKNVVGSVINWFGRFVPAVFSRVVGLVKGYINIYRTVIVTAFNVVRSVISGVMNAVRGIVSGVWGAIKNIVSNGAGNIVNTIKSVPGKILGLAGKFLEAGKSVMSKIFEGIKSAATGAAGFVSDIVGGIKSGINSALNLPFTINGPGPLPDFTIPAFARGTQFAPGGIALVGEQGPELVDVPRGSRVFTASQTERMTRTALPQEADLSAMLTHQIDQDMAGDRSPREIIRVVTLDGKVLAEAVFQEQRTAEART